MTLFLKFHDGEGIPCQNNIMGSRGVGGGGGGNFLTKLCNGITGKSSYKIIYFRVLEVI